MNPRTTRRTLSLIALASLVLGIEAGVACSTSSSASGNDAACMALSECCLAMGTSASVECEQLVTAARNDNDESACTTTLTSYEQNGLCGSAAEAGSPGHLVDSGTSCLLTGTCPGSGSGGNGMKDTGTPFDDGGAPTCEQLGTCDDSGGGGSGSGSGPSSGMDAGDTCGTTPTLHAELEAGVYCPFTTAGSIHCTTGQECCETPSTTPNGSTCQTTGDTCPVTGSLTWDCNGSIDCTGSSAGSICCAAGTVAEDTTCGFDRGSGFTGSHCATSCVSGEVTICNAAADPVCAGAACTPFKVSGVVLGACL